MKLMRRLLCGGLALALCLGLAACEKEEDASSVSEESSFVTPAPTPTAEPTPEPESSTFVPAEDLIPQDSEKEPDDFDEAFSQNPIDKAYDADYAAATSFSLMRQACDVAARRWRNMVDEAYSAALDVVGSGERSPLREEQSGWEELVESKIDLLRQEAADDNEGILKTARQVVLLYRERAMELCRVFYEATGRLPDFPDPSQEAAG